MRQQRAMLCTSKARKARARRWPGAQRPHCRRGSRRTLAPHIHRATHEHSISKRTKYPTRIRLLLVTLPPRARRQLVISKRHSPIPCLFFLAFYIAVPDRKGGNAHSLYVLLSPWIYFGRPGHPPQGSDRLDATCKDHTIALVTSLRRRSLLRPIS
ncbi:hypothetical protein DFH08DRAFT_1088338 [Mycena albidolilacea]|uniref:Uncharacterized protein n=1 Tax=Mycena albidolilacea TaxID=1033008 RepID=A0AAD6Z5T9_9AGAR|nr:hypothetical protein DFH08DRAFT_1088338 [Mycena albidolilacea]